MTDNKPARRSRQRTMAPTPTAAQGVPPATQALIVEAYQLARAAAAAKTAYDKVRKKLYVAMKEAGATTYKTVAKVPDTKEKGAMTTVSLVAEVSAPVTDVVDTTKAAKALDADVFATLVKITKGDLEKAIGEAPAKLLTYPVTGTENVTVKAE